MKKTVYLDNAATSFPKPERVCYEMYKCTREYCGNPGRGTNALSLKASETIYEARASLKNYFNAQSEENVIFTLNATYALNMAIKCFLPERSHVLISDIEHNAVYRPVVSEALMGKISFDFFSTFDGDKDKILSDIYAKTKRNTSAIICTAASNICNLTLPIEEIGKYAKERNILFIIDASQYAGHKKIDMQKMNVSILCAPAHKGLYGPQGCGFMIISEGVKPKRTIIEGGSGVNSQDIRMPVTLPEMFEAGTLNTQNARGLSEAIDYLENAGIENIEKYEAFLSQRLREALFSRDTLQIHGDYCEGGVYSVTCSTHSTEKFAALLDENGIMVRSGLHCAPLAHKKLGTLKSGTVRFSLGIFNTISDIEYLDHVLNVIL